jgi:hypothetical protein
MLGWTLALTVATSQLGGVRISITVENQRARVEATYRLNPPGDTVVYRAIRIPGQSVVVEHPNVTEGEVSPGLTRLPLAVSAPGESIHTIGYVVIGRVDRLPLFVPDVVTGTAAQTVVIEIRGVDRATPLGDAFPRLRRSEDGTLTAQTGDMPSFVLIPKATNPIGANLLADLAAVTVIVLGTIYWIARRVGRS